jgi:hypothetical protein
LGEGEADSFLVLLEGVGEGFLALGFSRLIRAGLVDDDGWGRGVLAFIFVAGAATDRVGAGELGRFEFFLRLIQQK